MYCQELFERSPQHQVPQRRFSPPSGLTSPLSHAYNSKQLISHLLSHTSASPHPQTLSFDILPQTIGGRVGYLLSKHPSLSSRPEVRVFRGPSWKDRGKAASILTTSVRANFLSADELAPSLPFLPPRTRPDSFRKPSLHSFLPSSAGDSNRLDESFQNSILNTDHRKLPPLTPFPASLTKRPSRKSFSYYSYAKHPGVGVVT